MSGSWYLGAKMVFDARPILLARNSEKRFIHWEKETCSAHVLETKSAKLLSTVARGSEYASESWMGVFQVSLFDSTSCFRILPIKWRLQCRKWQHQRCVVWIDFGRQRLFWENEGFWYVALFTVQISFKRYPPLMNPKLNFSIQADTAVLS